MDNHIHQVWNVLILHCLRVYFSINNSNVVSFISKQKQKHWLSFLFLFLKKETKRTQVVTQKHAITFSSYLMILCVVQTEQWLTQYTAVAFILKYDSVSFHTNVHRLVYCYGHYNQEQFTLSHGKQSESVLKILSLMIEKKKHFFSSYLSGERIFQNR